MSAPKLILRIMVASVLMIAISTTLVFGFTEVLEPWAARFGGVGPANGWGDLSGTTLMAASSAGLGLLLTLLVWFVAAPVQNDVRQEVRRR